MFYHVIRRPLHRNTTDSSNQPKTNRRSESVSSSTLMPRYHYSRTNPNSVTNTFDSFLPGNHFDEPTMTATTSNNNNNSYGSFKSTFIPFVTNNQTTTPPPSNMREFIQIPITRENGTSMITNNYNRAVPITYISETRTSSPTVNNNENTNLKPSFTNLLRPNSRYFQHNFNNITDEPTATTTSNTPHLPSTTRRLSLSIPVMSTTKTTSTDDNTTSQSIPLSPLRQIPIRFPQTATGASTPANNSRVSSAILRSSPISHALQRRKTDIGHASSTPTLLTINNPQQSLSDVPITSSNTLPIRRAEAMAREAIQNLAQQQQQQRNSPISENNNRSPPLSRRVIINLKNNQTVSLDSHVSSATKLPPIPSSSHTTQRNNIYHIPVLHELQMPPHPVSTLSEPSFQSAPTSNNNGSYKNEFHLKIPVTITTSNDQENQRLQNYVKEDGFIRRERLRSTNNNSNQTLKSILKRSSSRDTLRKNVSFMNA